MKQWPRTEIRQKHSPNRKERYDARERYKNYRIKFSDSLCALANGLPSRWFILHLVDRSYIILLVTHRYTHFLTRYSEAVGYWVAYRLNGPDCIC